MTGIELYDYIYLYVPNSYVHMTEISFYITALVMKYILVLDKVPVDQEFIFFNSFLCIISYVVVLTTNVGIKTT